MLIMAVLGPGKQAWFKFDGSKMDLREACKSQWVWLEPALLRESSLVTAGPNGTMNKPLTDADGRVLFHFEEPVLFNANIFMALNPMTQAPMWTSKGLVVAQSMPLGIEGA